MYIAKNEKDNMKSKNSTKMNKSMTKMTVVRQTGIVNIKI